VDINLLFELCEMLSHKDKAKALRFLNDNIEKGLDIQEFTKALVDYLRKLLILKIDPTLADLTLPGETDELKARFIKQAENLKKII